MTLTLEEMITNAILTPHKRFTHITWQQEEYLYWHVDNTVSCFKNEENICENLSEYATIKKGWIEWK